MGRVQMWLAPSALLCCAALMTEARAEDADVVEIAASETRVIVTKELEEFGFGLQDAHNVAVFATDGIVLTQEPAPCLVYLVTIYWCENVGGVSQNKMMRFRLDASCLDGFFPDVGCCLGVMCPVGTRPMLKLHTGAGFCYGIPANGCVFAEFSGPVLSMCSPMPDCACLPDLLEGDCAQFVECVPVNLPLPGGASVPTGCPLCN